MQLSSKLYEIIQLFCYVKYILLIVAEIVAHAVAVMFNNIVVISVDYFFQFPDIVFQHCLE